MESDPVYSKAFIEKKIAEDLIHPTLPIWPHIYFKRFYLF